MTYRLGIPYADGDVDERGRPTRICPVCGERCLERADEFGEQESNVYGEHYERVHGDAARPNTRWWRAADTLLNESGSSVTKWRTGMTGIAFSDRREIEAPEPRGAASFAVFAHEIGHVVLHGKNGSYPRWREEVEAWEFALAAFDRFGFEVTAAVEHKAEKGVAYAFAKAVRRGVDEDLIASAYPDWWYRVRR